MHVVIESVIFDTGWTEDQIPLRAAADDAVGDSPLDRACQQCEQQGLGQQVLDRTAIRAIKQIRR
jgi:hypothetical protein